MLSEDTPILIDGSPLVARLLHRHGVWQGRQVKRLMADVLAENSVEAEDLPVWLVSQPEWRVRVEECLEAEGGVRRRWMVESNLLLATAGLWRTAYPGAIFVFPLSEDKDRTARQEEVADSGAFSVFVDMAELRAGDVGEASLLMNAVGLVPCADKIARLLSGDARNAKAA